MIFAVKPQISKAYRYRSAVLLLLTLSLTPCLTLTNVLPARAASLESAYKAGDYPYAIYEANNIIKKDPKNLVAHYYLANIYSRQGDYKQALTHYAFCAEFGKGTKVGIYAETALKEMESKRLQNQPASTQNALNPSALSQNKNPQSVDQIKIDLLKQGSQEIEARRQKLQTELDALKVISDRESLKFLPEPLRAQYKDTPASYFTNLGDNPAVEQFLETRKRYQLQMDTLKAKAEQDIARINRQYLDKLDYIDQKAQLSAPGGVRAGGGGPVSRIRRNSPVQDYVNYGTEQEVDSIPVEPPLTATPQKLTEASKNSKSKTIRSTGKAKSSKVK